MAGVKGRSGGPRPNSGGARPGAGRKPKPPPVAEPTDESDPLAFLISVMQGRLDASPAQLKAAVAAVQYVHAKGSNKKDRPEVPKSGKYAPRLVSSR